MAITKIKILNEGQWGPSEDIGVISTNEILAGITQTALSSDQDVRAAKVSTNETGTQAWNKYNQLCEVIYTLRSDIDEDVNEALPQSKNITLTAGGWNDCQYNYQANAGDDDYGYILAQGFVYWISPISIDLNGIYADQITNDNQLTFHALTNPENDVIINITRMKEAAQFQSSQETTPGE